MRWVLAVACLAGAWLFPYEAWRDLAPWRLAIAIAIPWTLAAAAWRSVLPDGWPTTVRLAAILVLVDILVDLAVPYPRRYTSVPWELARIAALVVAAWLAPKLARARRTARGLRIASLVFTAHIPIAMAAIAIMGSDDEAAPADAALVLGFALAEDGTPRPQLVARVDRAVELYQRKLVPRLIMTGGVAKAGRTEASVMRDLALARGVPAEAVVLEEQSRSTIENFACSGPVLQTLGAQRVLLVTEPWHMSRALLLARRHGLDLRAAPASSPVWESPRHAVYWLFRDANAFVRESLRQPFAEPSPCRSPNCDGCRKM